MKLRGRILVSMLGAVMMFGQLSPAQAADQTRSHQGQHQQQASALLCTTFVDCTLEQVQHDLCLVSALLCGVPPELCTNPEFLPINTDNCVSEVDNLLLTLDALDDLIPDLVDPEQLLDDLDILLGDDCGKPDVGLPYKSAKYTVAVDAIETCDSQHTYVSVGVILEVRKGGSWQRIGGNANDKVNANNSGTATATGSCVPDTDRKYRGFAGGGPDGAQHYKAGDAIKIGCPTGVEIIRDPLP